MNSRRDFLKKSAVATGAIVLPGTVSLADPMVPLKKKKKDGPIVVSTWNHGLLANQAAWKILGRDGQALDAVERGVNAIESDPTNMSVGWGGRPDREGKVTLDACIMDHESRCGAVAFLEDIENPVSVARLVMDETPHVMLVGDGAKQFALEHDFEQKNLLTEQAQQEYLQWLEESKYKPVINVENHDTIGMLAIDAEGNLAGSCTTSGMAYKLHGRVGDSPIIGAGLFVDGEVGAACATGVGEAVIRVAGSSIIVELMRAGATPQEACDEAINRILKKHADHENLQVGFLALDKNGQVGASAVYAGFDYAIKTKEQDELIVAKYQMEWE